MSSLCKPEYLVKASQLSKEESEQLFSRMQGRLPRRLHKDKISQEVALAIQMELEDEQLQNWRKTIRMLREQEQAKKGSKAKDSAKSLQQTNENGAETIKSSATVKAQQKPRIRLVK